jgi:hypothetical protein
MVTHNGVDVDRLVATIGAVQSDPRLASTDLVVLD